MASDIWRVTHRPRLNCPQCGRSVAINKSGKWHLHVGKVPRFGCPMEGKPAPLHLLKRPWPCPHCGGEKVHVETFDLDSKRAMVCDKCGARGPMTPTAYDKNDLHGYGDNYSPALHAWNVRKP